MLVSLAEAYEAQLEPTSAVAVYRDLLRRNALANAGSADDVEREHALLRAEGRRPRQRHLPRALQDHRQ